MASGVGTQAANFEAPERMSPSSWCNPVKMDCLFNSSAFSDNLAITVLFVTATVTVFIFL